MNHPVGRIGLAVLAALLMCVTAAVATSPKAAAAPVAVSTIVALGDSTASGEGGGDYAPGTRGEGGDWCHRSANAYVTRTGLAQQVVNLACSGARSANVGFGSALYDTEPSQAQRLVQVARTHRVTVVVAQLGANDDPQFGQSVVRCVAAYLDPNGPGCAATLGPQWPARVAAMRPKVASALNDVRSAMRQAGYADTDYVLVVASYASPVSEAMERSHGFVGCPFRTADARWGRTQAIPQLSDALHQVADQVGARFLDLSRATEGHEACTSSGRPEWVRRLTVNTKVFAQEGFAGARHVAQESFHPNAVGDAQLGRCLGEFVRGGTSNAACVAGSDGNLHAMPAERSAPLAAG